MAWVSVRVYGVCIDLSFICVLVIALFAQLSRVLFFCIASHGQGIYMIRARSLEWLALRALWEFLDFYFILDLSTLLARFYK